MRRGGDRPLRRAVILCLLSAACGGGNVPPPPDLPAVARQVSLLRFPRTGGPVTAFLPDSLIPAGWSTPLPAPPLRLAIGADLDERLAYALDEDENLVAIDLESRGIRRQLMPGVSAAVMGPDGSLYVARADRRIVRLVRRTPLELTDPLAGAPRAMYGTVSGQVVVVTPGSPRRLLFASSERAVHEELLPEGSVAATYWGDLLAVAADTAIILYETSGDFRVRSARVTDRARDVTFSPSGHRIYVARDSRDVVVLDRYGLGQLPSIRLPGAPRAIRTDASGRWLLARPAESDSVWVVDLATGRPAASLPTAWASDLPLVAGAATLIARQGDDVVAWDLRSVPPKRLATLVGAGPDSWLAVGWVPRDRLPAAVAAAESATVTQDSALVGETSFTPADSVDIYVQVSTSQNPDWAEDLADRLRDEGVEATVLKPKGDQEAYRVVIGPFQTREAAEETGRRLGRPYFILRLPRSRT